MGRKGVPKPLVAVVASSDDINITGQAVSALRRLASNAENAIGMVRVSRTAGARVLQRSVGRRMPVAPDIPRYPRMPSFGLRQFGASTHVALTLRASNESTSVANHEGENPLLHVRLDFGMEEFP